MILQFQEYFKKTYPLYTNISLQFTGIGHLVIYGNSLITFIERKFKLNIKNIPLHTYKHAMYFLISNLKSAGFDVITIFFSEEEDIYRRIIAEYIKSINECKSLREINDYLNNERIALIVGDKSPKSLEFLFECISRNLYVALLDDLEFLVPFVYAFVYQPLSIKNTENIEVSDCSLTFEPCSYESIDEDIKKIYPQYNLSIIQHEFNTTMNEMYYKSSDEEISECLAKQILAFLLERKHIEFDGRILLSEGVLLENKSSISLTNIRTLSDKRAIKEIKPEKLELDLLVNHKQTKASSSIIHLRNIQKSALSLFDGKLLFSPIIKQKELKQKKVSKKQMMIIEENEKRLKKEQAVKDNIWLRNFFNKYKQADKQGKRFLLESTVPGNVNIAKKLLLLKIEYYSDIWNLEKRSEECDERCIVPCYLNCLEYIEKFVENGKENSEHEFVFQKLIDLGFEATVHELLKKKNLKMSLEFFTEDTAAPSDYDICFQLKYTSDKLKRSLGSKDDARVLFKPDGWQIKLLNLVDANKSAVVAAPTSSGKTFICFYAIEKILRQSDTDMVVFCLPTKALANQVSADIYARFAQKVNVKTNIQGSLMKDFANDPFNCQVLITIPSLLESILNCPPPKILSRIKYIIIDEVHKISSEEMGSPIERIFHLSPCPMLVLSATLGNLQGFYEWMAAIEKSKNRECDLVVHNERYCELKPYVYSKSSDDKLGNVIPINNLFAYSYEHIKKFGFGNDISFLPEELLYLFDSLCATLTEDQKELLYPLVPENFFKSNILTKKDCKDYEKHLLKYFQNLIKENKLTEKQIKKIYKMQTKESKKAFENINSFDEDYIVDNILDLLNSLKEKNMLPCIVFNTDRDFISKVAVKVYEKLEEMDKEIKKNKVLDKIKKEAKRNRDAEKSKDSWIEESLIAERSFEMKVDKKNIKYTFLDPLTKVTDYELEQETKYIKNTAPEFIDMMYRGIGVHHEQMNRRYRNVAEILFRQKHLRVLFATETLALGINMPCRSVVFAGDSLFLDPLNYKQMAGRAGRRGYDTLGNIVFMGIPQKRVQNLMVSLLTNIKGVYTYTNTSFVGFNIKESLLKYPLLESTMCDSSKKMSKDKDIITDLSRLNLKETIIDENLNALKLFEKEKERHNYDLYSLFAKEEERRNLVHFQESILSKFFNKNSYLNELIISNRETDQSIFMFCLLLENNLIDFEPKEFMNTISHLFEVKPVIFEMDHVLPPMSKPVYDLCAEVNKLNKSSLSTLYSPVLRILQHMSNEPLHNILSFLYVNHLDSFKNSYLLDFFKNGNKNRILKENKIRSADLFKSLSIIDNLLVSLMRWYTKYEEDSGILKKISVFYALFEPKFKAIFA